MAQEPLSDTLIKLFAIRFVTGILLSLLFFGVLNFSVDDPILSNGKSLTDGEVDNGMIQDFNPNLKWELGLLTFPDLSYITKFFNLVVMMFKYAIAFDMTLHAYASAVGLENVTFFMLIVYYFPQIPLIFRLIGAVLNRIL